MASYARSLRVGSLATTTDGPNQAQLTSLESAQAIVEGMTLALFHFDKYKTEENERQEIASLTFVEPNRTQVKAAQRGAEIGRILGESANFARVLVNHPGNEMTPTMLAEQARQMAKENGLKCEILERKDMEKRECYL